MLRSCLGEVLKLSNMVDASAVCRRARAARASIVLDVEVDAGGTAGGTLRLRVSETAAIGRSRMRGGDRRGRRPIPAGAPNDVRIVTHVAIGSTHFGQARRPLDPR